MMSQKSQSVAEEELIPDFNGTNFAGFIYEELNLGRVNFTGGIRNDARTLDVQASDLLAIEEQARGYSTASGTLGAVWRAATPWALAVNVGRGWRAPTAFELFVDGVHEGTVRYEIGDSQLDSEQSLNVDFSVRYIGPCVHGEIAVFQNSIDKFIYLQPTQDVDHESGYAKYHHQQADATLQGGEFVFEGQAASWLVLTGGGNLVRGTNTKTSYPLPLMPADRLRIGAKFIQPRVWKLINPFCFAEIVMTANADRVDTEESRTGGYSLFNIGMGGEFSVGNSRATVDLVADNLFNKSYRDHLSRYKEYALNPGRNVTLKFGLPFTILP